MLRGENLYAWRTYHPSSTLSTTHPTLTGVDSKLNLRGDWPKTNGINPARSYIVYEYWRYLQALEVDTGVSLVELRETVSAIQ
jgi:hypothetical protein